MEVTDHLLKAMAYDDQVRVYVLNGTEMVETARQKQDTWHTATAALGRMLLGTTLLGMATLKEETDKLSVRIDGDGPIGYMVADTTATGQTKGYVAHPHVALPSNADGKLDVSGAVGTTGMLSVAKDLGLKTPFTGQVELVSGELAEDFTYYLAASEQIPSAIGLSVLVNPDESVEVAGGFLIQVLPDASEETVADLERALAELPNLSDNFAAGDSNEQIVERLVGKNYRVLEEVSTSWHCDCSKNRFKRALTQLDSAEIEQMIDEDGQAEAVCHFCGEKYLFTKKELEEIAQTAHHKQ